MKKVLFIVMSIMFIGAGAAQAQNSFIGGRINGGAGIGAELSYVKELNTSNQIELNVGGSAGLTVASIYATGSYQWRFPIANIDGFQWYVGPAVAVGTDTYGADLDFFVAAGAQGGVSYEFDFPLQLAFDARPLVLGFGTSGYYGLWDAGFSVRYRIGG